MKSGRLINFLTILLSFAPALWTFSLIFIWKAPYWLYFDPDLFYFANGVNFALHHTVGIYDNPATVTEMLCGVLMLPVWWLSKVQGLSLPDFSIEHVREIVSYLKLAFSLLASIGIYLFSIAVEKITKVKNVRVVAVLLLLSISLVSVNATRIMPEATAIFLCGAWIYAYARFHRDKPGMSSLYFMAFVAGMALANKYTAFPVALFTVIVIRNFWRGWLALSGGFILGILPIIIGPPYLFKSVQQTFGFLIHKGLHGTGAIGWPTLQDLYNGAKILAFQERYFVVFLIVSLIAVVLSSKNPEKNSKITGNVFLLCGLAFLPVSFRYAVPYYASISLLFVGVYLIIQLSRCYEFWKGGVKGGMVVLLILLFSLNILRTGKTFQYRAELCRELDSISADILKNSDFSVAFGWTDPLLPPWALMAANNNARSVFSEVLIRKFPNYYFADMKSKRMAPLGGRLAPFQKPAVIDYLFFPHEFVSCCFDDFLRGTNYSVLRDYPNNKLTLIKIEREVPQ